MFRVLVVTAPRWTWSGLIDPVDRADETPDLLPLHCYNVCLYCDYCDCDAITEARLTRHIGQDISEISSYKHWSYPGSYQTRIISSAHSQLIEMNLTS